MAKKEAPIEEPKEFRRDDVKTTKISDLKDVIKLKMDQLKDLATMEVMLPVDVRLKKRLESIRKMSSANSMKINGHWKTIAPEMYVTCLEGRNHNESEAEIRFSVYETDAKGNKKPLIHYADVVLPDGTTIRRPTSAEYPIAYEVIERIVYRKPITREIIRVKPREQGNE